MNAMRETIYNLRYQWLGVRIGGAGATLKGRWVALSLSLVVVFACFFAVGRIRTGAGSSAVTPALASSSGQTAIPAGLSGGSPIAGAVPIAIAVKPRPRPRPVVVPVQGNANLGAASPVQPLSAEPSRREPPTAESQASSAPASQAAPEPAPSKASVPSRGGGGSAPSGQRSAPGGSHSSGGGSFDSSG